MTIDTVTPTSRRALLAGLAGGLATALAGTLGRAQPASAHDPDDVRLGDANQTTFQTSIANTRTNGPAFTAYGNGTGWGVYGYSRSGRGVLGASVDGYGVYGSSEAGQGIYGTSDSLAGVYGEGASFAGVYGLSETGDGAFGESSSGHGVKGFSATGAGVRGESVQGRGGVFSSSATAQIRLQPSSAATHPSSGNAGDLFVDTSKRLWFCKGGTAWKQLA